MKKTEKNNGRCLFNRRGLTLMKAFMALLILTALPSCSNAIFEDLEPCEETHYYVKYIFDMNMSYADAFASKVNSVSLYVFDAENGDIVDVYTESGDALKVPGYRMEVDLEPGVYDLIAWCGLENNDDLFTLPETISHRDHAHCRMAREYNEFGRAVQNNFLHSLFHGRITADFPDATGDYEVTVPLIKDTNNINISMQHISGEPLTKDMFTVIMTEGNGHMAHDNKLLEDEDVDFYPWHLADGNVDITGGTRAGDDDSATLNYFKAEISTPRLMADRSPRINIIENATGNVVYSIPIVEWALEFRSEQHSEMGKQEYLDREDEFNVMLYLDNGEKGWVAASIFINGWRLVRHDNSEMGH